MSIERKVMYFSALIFFGTSIHSQDLKVQSSMPDKVIHLSRTHSNTQTIDAALINIKLISLEEKTWWVAQRIKNTAEDAEQKALIEMIQENAITMKNALMKDLKKRLCDQDNVEEDQSDIHRE